LREAINAGFHSCVRALIEHGANVNCRNSYPLSTAASQGDTWLVKMLLNAGADPNGRDGFCLISAIASAEVHIVRMLLDAGAELRWVKYIGYPLYHACQKGFKDIVQLLVERGAVVNAKDNSALIAASVHSDPDLVRILLENGAYALARDASALRRAVENGHPEVLLVLLKAAGDRLKYEKCKELYDLASSLCGRYKARKKARASVKDIMSRRLKQYKKKK